MMIIGREKIAGDVIIKEISEFWELLREAYKHSPFLLVEIYTLISEKKVKIALVIDKLEVIHAEGELIEGYNTEKLDTQTALKLIAFIVKNDIKFVTDVFTLSKLDVESVKRRHSENIYIEVRKLFAVPEHFRLMEDEKVVSVIDSELREEVEKRLERISDSIRLIFPSTELIWNADESEDKIVLKINARTMITDLDKVMRVLTYLVWREMQGINYTIADLRVELSIPPFTKLSVWESGQKTAENLPKVEVEVKEEEKKGTQVIDRKKIEEQVESFMASLGEDLQILAELKSELKNDKST